MTKLCETGFVTIQIFSKSLKTRGKIFSSGNVVNDPNCDSNQNFLGCHMGVIAASDFGQQHHEFIASQPRHRVCRAHQSAQNAGRTELAASGRTQGAGRTILAFSPCTTCRYPKRMEEVLPLSALPSSAMQWPVLASSLPRIDRLEGRLENAPNPP